MSPERIEANPWLRYWMGRSKTFLDLRTARVILNSAWKTFVAVKEEAGQLLCAITILEGHFFEFNDLRPMDPWIDRVVNLLQKGVRPKLKVDELRAFSSVMMGAAFRGPHHSMLDYCASRVVELLEEPFDANVKIATASMLQGYSNITMDQEVQRKAGLVAHPLLKLPQVPTSLAMVYLYSEGYSHYLYGRYEQALACFDEADSILGEPGSYDRNLGLRLFTRGLCERRAGLLDRAEATIRRIESASMPATGHFRGGYKLLKASVLFDRGNIDQAIADIQESFRAFDDCGHFNGTVLVGTVAANMAISSGRFDIATKVFKRLYEEKYGATAKSLLPAIALNEAWLAHRRGDSKAAERLLAAALEGARYAGARVRFRWYANAMAELLPLAFSKRIEKEVVTILVREFKVLPEPLDVEDWPWPVKIRCLGVFDVLVDGEKPPYSRKAPRKVLSLLKAIVAHGSREVPERKLVDSLWPDEEGDAARRALTSMLHRLRKLLGNTNAIRQVGGKLTLDSRYCWIDANVFESRLQQTGTDSEEFERALNLYGGAFLSQEEDAPWAVATRERLRSKFIQAVSRQATTLEAVRKYEDAVALYLRGIEADPLVENFYQGLMRSYDKLNRHTEAVSAFRRLRHTLSITLGVQPSPASQRLYEALRSN